jgi:hypothetical protein
MAALPERRLRWQRFLANLSSKSTVQRLLFANNP